MVSDQKPPIHDPLKNHALEIAAWAACTKALNTTVIFWRRKYQEKVFLCAMYREYIPKRDLKAMRQKAYQMAREHKFEN
jgi:hypothetical protein